MQSHRKGIHAVGTDVSGHIVQSGWRIGMAGVSPVPVSVLDGLVKHSEFLVFVLFFVELLALFLAFCQELYTFDRRFKIITNFQKQLFAILALLSIDEFNDDVSHESGALPSFSPIVSSHTLQT